MKKFNKAISVFVLAMFVMSLIPFGAFAAMTDEPVRLVFTNYAYSRPSASDISNPKDHVYGYATFNGFDCIQTGGSFNGYAQLDVSGYEEILANPSTVANIKLEAGYQYSGAVINNLIGYIAPDSADEYQSETVTWNIANSLGMHSKSNPVLFSTSSGEVKPGGVAEAEIDLDALNTALADGTDNSVISVYFAPNGGDSKIRISSENTGIFVLYDEDEIDNQDYVDTLADSLSWSEISSQSADAVSEDLELPASYRGAEITWSSSDNGLISDDGSVYLPKNPTEVTLTAELSYKGISDEVAVCEKEFVVTVSAEERTAVLLPVSNPKHTRSKNQNSASDPTDQSGSKITYVSLGGGDNNRYTYGQFDLTGYESILTNPGTKVTYSLYCGAGFSSNRAYDFKVQLFNDESDYNPETITFAEAAKLGLHGEGVATIFERTDTTAVRDVTSSAEVDADIITDVMNSGNGDSVITYAISTANSASSTFLPSAKNTGLEISYFESETDNDAFLANLADNLEWSDVSADSTGSVESDLATLYGGASIVWSADTDGVVTEDGKITCATQAQQVTLTANLTYNGVCGTEATATKTFDITVAAEKAVTVKIPLINAAYGRSSHSSIADSKNHAFKVEKWGTTEAITTGGVYRGYVQLDLSGYEEILKNPSTKLSFKANVGGRYSSGKFNDVKFVLAPDAADIYNPETITWNIATELGIHDANGGAPAGRPVLFAKSDGQVIPYNTTWPSEAEYPNGKEADIKALLDVLSESDSNSIVTLLFAPVSANQSTIRTNVEPTGFYITYFESEIDNKEYLDAIEKEFTWENLTSDSIDYAENKLPTFFRGADVTWSSENSVIASDGTFIKVKDVDREARITATVNYKDESFTKDFDVTVAGDKIKSVVIPLHSGTYVTKNSPASPMGPYDKSYYSRYMYPSFLYGDGNDRVVFLKWDFSEHLDKLAVAKSMSMNLKTVEKNTQAGSGTRLSVLPESYESWTEADLCYDSAAQTGLYTAPSLCEVTCPPLKPEIELTSSAEFLDAIKKSVADNPSNGVVNFRWEALSHSVTAYRLSGNEKSNFTITLYYYESDIAKANVEDMPWSFVSSQDIDKVVCDLTLPETFYGEPVAWASSNEAVIASSGEVFAGSEDAQVKLTATVDGVSKEFDVTVPAKNFTVKYDVSAGTTPEGINLYNYTNTHIYANKDAGTIPTLVVATYLNGKLLDIVVKENYEIKKGDNYLYSGAHKANSNNAEVKVFFMGELSGVTPIYDVNNK